MNRRDLDFLLQNLFEGTLDSTALAELERELDSNPDARQAYIEYAHLYNSLELNAQGIDIHNVVSMEQVNSRHSGKMIRKAFIFAAAAVVIIAAILAFIATPRPTLRFATSPGTEVWIRHEISGDKTPTGAIMEPGSTLEIGRGTVEVTFASGVRGIIRGPANISLQGPSLLHLEKGEAWFEVPKRAVGFQVTTPDLELTDLGTEFGIIAQDEFPHEVHVFHGMVEVTNSKGLRSKETLGAGEARLAEPDGGWRRISPDVGRFLHKLPKTEVPAEDTEVIVTSVANTDELAYMEDVVIDDLLHGLSPEADGWNFGNNAHPNELTDGIHGSTFVESSSDRVQGAWTKTGATATYQLGSGPNGSGYDIISIRSVAAWNSAGFGNQTWLVEVKPVGKDYHSLVLVDFHPFAAEALDGGGATKVTLTGKSGKVAQGIEAIRFTAGRVPKSVDGAFIWRELDVIGVPSAAEQR